MTDHDILENNQRGSIATGLAQPSQESSVRPFLFVAHVVTPMILGGMIYLLFRHDSLLMFQWGKALGVENILLVMRNYFSVINAPGFTWFFYSLPDCIWVYSFTSYMLIIWGGRLSVQSSFWVFLPIVLFSGGEIGQAFGLVTGTFDTMDLGLSLAGAAIPLILLTERKHISACKLKGMS